MTATEPLTNLSGGVESRHANGNRERPGNGEPRSVKDSQRLIVDDSGSGSSAPPAQHLCPDCESREIAPTEDLCVICWFARNDENPDGRWVNTEHAGWIYE